MTDFALTAHNALDTHAQSAEGRLFKKSLTKITDPYQNHENLETLREFIAIVMRSFTPISRRAPERTFSSL